MMNLNRRDATRLITILTATATSPDGLSHTARAISSGQVDPGVIDEIEAMILSCLWQEETFGPSAVLPTMLAQRALIEDLLRDCPDATRPRLLVAFGRTSTALAYYVFALGDVDGARRYCDEARRAAHEAGDVSLAAYALYDIAFFAAQAGKHDVSTDAGIAAGRLVRCCDDGRLRALIAERIADNHARQGNVRACMRGLDSALDCVDSGVTTTSPAYWFSKGKLLSRASTSELRLGQHEQAAVSAAAGLELCPPATGGRAFSLTRLADARVLAGEVPEAARLVAEAANLATRYRSPRLVTTLHASRGRMAPWKDTPAVRELDQRLADLDLIVPATV